ncbi:hypothetical protein HPP92_009006 [Vanilla planifolia]|uniref:Uncharacterized protein n=1 Tax=Vanilla planifolia TaxID=51239 RepID=A0A835V8F5_VANPL|nr:hypothetical protein HPP92_009006 [Vanilla planifolia]
MGKVAVCLSSSLGRSMEQESAKAQDLNKTVEAAVEAAEMVVEAAEKMVEAAEKVVEKAKKVVEEVAEAFPNRRLKEFAIKLEQIAAFADEKTSNR